MKCLHKYLIICFLFLLISAFCCFITATGSVIGDINGDGEVDRNDALLVYDYVSGTGFLSGEQLDIADIDGDGGVTIADVSLIFHKANGILDDIPYISDVNGCYTIYSLPDKLEYFEGEEIDLSGLIVGTKYRNDDFLIYDDYTYSGYDSTPGIKIVTVEHKGMKASFSVTVYPSETSYLEIVSEPIKKVYSVGEELDLTGFSVAFVDGNGNKRIIDSYTVDGYEPVPGCHEITVKYRMKTASFYVTVN